MEDEIFPVVDEQDQVIGSATKTKARDDNLLHRGAAVLLENSKGEIFVHKRTMTKEVAPGLYDVQVGGGVRFGESYEEAAKRELEEEVGIKNPKLELLFDYRMRSARTNAWLRVFKCVYDGKLKLQKEEIEHGGFVSYKVLDEMLKTKNFCKDGVQILNKYKK
ncbi:NUDIX domain-containing protein [Candidatus Woesearchaeota archaeon]|nr:NUDIX domain-containing protein [Candidatus Woesearchaeota archaeon]